MQKFYLMDIDRKLAWQMTNGSWSTCTKVVEIIDSRTILPEDAVPVDYQEANHSTCSTSCTRRGDAKCGF